MTKQTYNVDPAPVLDGESSAGAPDIRITPAMIAAARKVLWDSGALKHEMPGIDDGLVKEMLNAAFKTAVKASRQKP